MDYYTIFLKKAAVVNDNKRPGMPWMDASPGLSQLAEIISDCLAREPESRRSAANVVERLKVLMRADGDQPEDAGFNDREDGGADQMEMVPLVSNGNATPAADA